jgi:hypothetical protein
MNKLVTCALTLALGATIGTTAMAQTASSQPVVYPKVQKVILTGTKLTGDRDRPSGTTIVAPPKFKHERLIKLRMDFRDKMAQSVNEL